MRTFYDNQVKEENRLFANFLVTNGLVQKNDILVEYAFRIEDSISANEELHEYPRIIYSTSFPCNRDISEDLSRFERLGDHQVNLICNGFNHRIKNFNHDFAFRNVFNIGICSPINGEYTYGKMELVKYEKELLAKGIKVEHIESLVGEKNMIYLLTNRGFNNGR